MRLLLPVSQSVSQPVSQSLQVSVSSIMVCSQQRNTKSGQWRRCLGGKYCYPNIYIPVSPHCSSVTRQLATHHRYLYLCKQESWPVQCSASHFLNQDFFTFTEIYLADSDLRFLSMIYSGSQQNTTVHRI